MTPLSRWPGEPSRPPGEADLAVLVEDMLEGRVVDASVVGRAEQPTLLHAGPTSSAPRHLVVVSLRHRGRRVATCGRAPSVADPHRDALGLGVEAPFAADVERHARPAEHDRDDAGAAGD